jgi:uncharacterized protein
MFRFIAACLIVASFIAAPAAFAEERKMPRLISLSGHGEVKSAPDMAIVSLGTLSQAATAKEALAANTTQMTALIAMLKEQGIEAKDIQTSNFNVNPRYENASSGAARIGGYDVSNSVTITVRKLADLGCLLDKAISTGSNQVNGIELTVADPQSATDDARKAAVKDALRKATLLADAAGVKLGSVVSISESGGAMPVPMVRGMAMNMAAKASAPVPVAEGQVAISADINMAWEIE